MDTSFEPELLAMIAELEPQAQAGDPKAQYDLSGLCHDLAVRRQSWEYFDRAETLLRASAAARFPAAIERLSSWHVLRYALQRRIERSSDA